MLALGKCHLVLHERSIDCSNSFTLREGNKTSEFRTCYSDILLTPFVVGTGIVTKILETA